MIQYPPTPITPSAQSSIMVSGYPDTQAIVIYNESPYFLNVQLVGSGSVALAAFTADVCQIFSGFTGNIIYTPVNYLNNSNSAPPSSNAFVQTFGINDALVQNIKNKVSTGYPLSLVRQVNSDVGNATTLTNTGYPPGQTVLFAEPVGDNGAQGAVVIFNNGGMILGDSLYNGILTLDDVTGGQFILTGTGCNLGNLSTIDLFVMDASGNITCANGKTEILAGPANETHIVNLAGSDIVFQSPLGTEVARITNGGSVEARTSGATTAALTPNGVQADTILPFSGDSMSLNDQSGTPQLRVSASGINVLNELTLPHGTLNAISKIGSISLTTTSTAFNHNLGVVPDIIILQVNGTSSSSVITKVDYTSFNSTTFNAVASVACTAFGIAIKF